MIRPPHACLFLLLAVVQCVPAQEADRAIPAEPATQSSKSIAPARPPETGTQRMEEAIRATFGPIAWVSSAASAGIGQWRDRPDEWGQGAAGFGRRYASSFAGRIVKNSITFGVASAFGEDNRYVPSGLDTKRARIKYAVASTFLARRPDGSRHVSYSRIAGWLGAAAISRAWQPDSTRTVRSGLAALYVSIGVAAGFEVAHEFLPRIFH